MATIKGKQHAVEEGTFLQFLRSVGYRAELPPSTVAWLESAPVFRFLASKLSHDNFVAPDEQQEYNEIMLARGPNAELYEALSSASSDDESEAAGADAQHAGDQGWLGEQPEPHLMWAIQAKETEVQQLEQQIAALKALSTQLELSVSEQRSSQTRHIAAQASAGQRLAAAKADAGRLNTELNNVLQDVSQACSDLARLLLEPQQWLLAAADMRGYKQQNEDAIKMFGSLMALMNVAGASQQSSGTLPATTTLHPPAPVSAAAAPEPPAAATAAAAFRARQPAAAADKVAWGGDGAGGKPSAALMTPRQQQQWAGALQQVQEADARRHADQEEANAALRRELTRQRVAFKLVLEAMIRAELEHAGAEGQLVAAQHVKAGSGGFANYRRKGEASLHLLAAELSDLEQCKQQLVDRELPALIDTMARLNDTTIVAGDYQRQVYKMTAARNRKVAVLQALLGMSSRHLLLLMLGSQEQQQLLGLGQQLSAVAQQLERHASNTRARTNRCIAAGHSLQEAQQRSNLQPDDSYLLALLAAAQGSLSTNEEVPTAAATAARTSLLQTPVAAGAAAAAGTPLTSARTPSYLPVKRLTDQLHTLGSGTTGGAAALQELLQELPQQLQHTKEAARQLHLLAFPPEQQAALQAAAAAAGGGGGSSTKGDGGSSSYAPSAATSVTSKRSTGSSSTQASGAALLQLQQHPLPLLRLPEVTEAALGAEAAAGQLSKEILRLVMRQNDAAKLQGSNRPDHVLERGVMAMFFNRPAALAARVRELREEVAALELAEELEQQQLQQQQN